MQKIQFNKTNHVFLDNGIIALYRYLESFEKQGRCKRAINRDFLEIEAEDILLLLEEVYFVMGKEIYDTSKASDESHANTRRVHCNQRTVQGY